MAPKLTVLDASGHTTVEPDQAEEEFEKLIRHSLGYVKTKEGKYEQVREFPREADEVFITPQYVGG